MALKVLYGGAIRYGEPIVSASETTNWLAGRILKVNSSNQVQLATGVATEVLGVALKDRISTTGGPNTSLVRVGAPTGERVDMLMGLAVFSTDQLTSGSTFVAGDSVYVGNDAKFCSSGSSSRISALVVGKALSDGASGDTARPLTMFFEVQY